MVQLEVKSKDKGAERQKDLYKEEGKVRRKGGLESAGETKRGVQRRESRGRCKDLIGKRRKERYIWNRRERNELLEKK